LVYWTGRERIRCLWYRFRLTVEEMNYATPPHGQTADAPAMTTASEPVRR